MRFWSVHQLSFSALQMTTKLHLTHHLHYDLDVKGGEREREGGK
jgi:hypothetical protein